MQNLINFLAIAAADSRLSAVHICLYVYLWKLRRDRGADQPLHVFSHEVMSVCKISSFSTYHKTIKDLHLYGFIRYSPSRNHYVGSLVDLVDLARQL